MLASLKLPDKIFFAATGIFLITIFSQPFLGTKGFDVLLIGLLCVVLASVYKSYPLMAKGKSLLVLLTGLYVLMTVASIILNLFNVQLFGIDIVNVLRFCLILMLALIVILAVDRPKEQVIRK
jgi:hypothetical protein